MPVERSQQDVKRLLQLLAAQYHPTEWDYDALDEASRLVQVCGYRAIADALLLMDPVEDTDTIIAYVVSWITHNDHYCSCPHIDIEDETAKRTLVTVLCRQMEVGTTEYDWVVRRRCAANMLHCLRACEAVLSLLRSLALFGGPEAAEALCGVGSVETISQALHSIDMDGQARFLTNLVLEVLRHEEAGADPSTIGRAMKRYREQVPNRIYRHC